MGATTTPLPLIFDEAPAASGAGVLYTNVIIVIPIVVTPLTFPIIPGEAVLLEKGSAAVAAAVVAAALGELGEVMQ